MSKQQKINIRVTMELKAKLQKMADEQDRSLSYIAVKLLEEATQEKKKK